MICYPAVIHLRVKIGIETGPWISHSSEFSWNPEQGVVSKSSKWFQKYDKQTLKYVFPILKWCPHLKLRRNLKFNDIGGYIRDVKVSGIINCNELGYLHILELAQNVIHSLFEYFLPTLGQLINPSTDLLLCSHSFVGQKLG